MEGSRDRGGEGSGAVADIDALDPRTPDPLIPAVRQFPEPCFGIAFGSSAPETAHITQPDRTMSTRIFTLTTALVIAALAAVPARAQGGVEFGGFGSYTQFDTSLALKERAGAGARLSLISGYGWSTFILEAEGGYSEQKLGVSSIKYIPARARLLYVLPIGSTASLLIGGGGVRNEYMVDSTHSNDWGYTGLAGLRVKLGSFMTLRIDAVVDYIENPVNESDLFP